MARLNGLFLIAAALLLAGCPSLPDTQPFTDATVGLRGAVASSGTAVVAELKRNPVDGMAAQGAGLEKAWQVRTKAMTALVDYANSLQAIADSGRKGEESAQKLADAATTLVQTLGAANLAASSAAGLAIDTFKFANGQIARARAAKSLEAALAEMQPAIERIAELLAADLTDLDTIVQAAIDAQHDRLERDNQSEINYRQRLLAARRNLMGKAANQLDQGVNPTALAGGDDLKRTDELLAANEAWRTAYTAQQAAIAERGRLASEMIGAAQAAFADWTAAHARLLAAVRARRIPSMAELTDAAKRIRDLVDRYRKL